MKDSFPTVLPYLDGVMLGVGAIADAYLVIDGYGCHAQRVERYSGNHDLGSTLTDWQGYHRVLTTQLESADLALGTGAQLERTLRRLVRARRPPGVVFVTPSATVAITAPSGPEDLARLRPGFPVPLLEVKGPILQCDWLDGYGDLLRAAAEQTTRPRSARRAPGGGRSPRAAGEVLVVGNLWTRAEQDEIANADVLRRLLSGLGLRARSIWLDGRAWRAYAPAGPVRGIVGLPYGREAAAVLARKLRVPLCDAGLPIGFAGTAAWLRAVAAAFGQAERAERLIRRELAAGVPRFTWAAAKYLVGRSVALCADPHLAAGLVGFLTEMGMRVEWLVLETRHPEHLAHPAFAGLSGTLADPSWKAVRDKLRALALERRIDLVIGNTQKRGMAPGVPFLELGVPSYQHHAFVRSPYYGFEGAAGFLQRIVNLLASRDEAVR